MTRYLPALLATLVVPAFAQAHAVGVGAKIVGETVRIEVFFDDDTPADGATVTVRDGANGLIAEGVTDDKGVWSFAVPAAGKYAVRVDAGGGHAATAVVTIPERAAPDTAISDGPSREAFTGWQRWATAAVGVALIAAGTWLVKRRLRANGGA